MPQALPAIALFAAILTASAIDVNILVEWYSGGGDLATNERGQVQILHSFQIPNHMTLFTLSKKKTSHLHHHTTILIVHSTVSFFKKILKLLILLL